MEVILNQPALQVLCAIVPDTSSIPGLACHMIPIQYPFCNFSCSLNQRYGLLFFYVFIFCLCWVFIAASGLSPVALSRGYSLVEVCRLLIAVASLVAEHSL